MFWKGPNDSALAKVHDCKFRKTYSTIERMDIYKPSIKVVIIPLNECKTRTYFFKNKYVTAERNNCKNSRQSKYCILQRMDDCYSFCDKNRYSSTPLQRKDGCKKSGEINLKKSHASSSFSKEVAVNKLL